MRLDSSNLDKGSINMKPREHQIEGAEWALKTIRKYGLAYLSWEERTGKTLTALLTVENSKARNCLIITKKKAIPGWEDTLYEWNHYTQFDVINYESIHKVDCENYDFIILDEAHHAISSVGRPSKTWKAVKKCTFNRPILYLSATPYAEHIGLLYHQLKLSDWTPLPQRNFYDFFRKYGIKHMTRTPYGLVETYTRYKTQDVLDVVKYIFNFKTRTDVGIEHLPQERVIKLTPNKELAEVMNKWRKHGVVVINDLQLLADSDMKQRIVHYQMEGGTIKTEEGAIYFNTQKIDYIKENYVLGNIAIMAHFVAERELMATLLPGVQVLSSDGDAEGVDLSGIDKLIIYSMSFKTSKHLQRMARQANHNRSTPIVVDIICMDKPAIGYKVYETVAIKKQNFVKVSYEQG